MKGSVATRPEVPGEAPGPSVALAALPFPAALLDSRGIITAINPEWENAHPGCTPGVSSVIWCRNRSPRFGTLLTGLRKVLAGTDLRHTEEIHGEGIPVRVWVSRAGQGVLVLEEALPEAERASLSQRLETIGRTVSGVAHDFANLLTLIGGYSDMLLSRMKPGDAHGEELREIQKAAERGAQLTSQLLTFARTAEAPARPINLNSLIGEAQRMLRPILGELIEVDLQLDPAIGPVLADAGRLEQVLMNLILNARDAMPSGGRIRVSTSRTELSPEEASRLEMAPGPCVVLSVLDSGPGIDPASIGRLFQPFYTTKAKGTGLGLSIVRRIVRECGGAIRVESSTGKGARFDVYLPESRPPAASGEAHGAPIPTKGSEETVLLVEDEESVRLLVARVLEQHGYKILEAADGEEALRMLEAHPNSIRLLVTDMVMPHMGGRELAARVRAKWPRLPIVCLSGYPDDSFPTDPGILFLQKPLHPDTLAAKVREALDSSSRPFNPR